MLAVVISEVFKSAVVQRGEYVWTARTRRPRYGLTESSIPVSRKCSSLCPVRRQRGARRHCAVTQVHITDVHLLYVRCTSVRRDLGLSGYSALVLLCSHTRIVKYCVYAGTKNAVFS